MILHQGDRGEAVELLQLKLKAAGYDPGKIDGDFGPATARAVLAFQKDRPDVDDDGICGPQTLGALDAAIAKHKPADVVTKQPNTFVPCDAPTWSAFQSLIASLTSRPVRYGPGRGLWVNGKFVITYGAGTLHGTVQRWPNVLGKPYSSFHCTSFANFILSWLTRRNEDYTHAGNTQSVFTLLESSPEVHQAPGAGPWRGFGDVCFPIKPSGDGAKRSGVAGVVDLQELYDRRAELPTFIVCAQSDKLENGSWNWWHHVVLFVTRDGELYRIAADGYRGNGGYSATPMKWIKITPQNLSAATPIYRPYGVNTHDGSYGDPSRPIAAVEFEAAA